MTPPYNCITNVLTTSDVDSWFPSTVIPVVTDDTARDTMFPSPTINQRVQNLAGGQYERWDGSAWVSDVPVDPSVVLGAGRSVTEMGQYVWNNAVFNVKDYGAIGDGVADDGTAISAACTAAAMTTVPARIYFPTGQYRTTAMITVPNGTELYAETNDVRVLFVPTDRTTSIAAFTFQHEVRISRLSVQGPGSPATPDLVYPVAAYRITGQRCCLEDFSVGGCEYGVFLHGVSGGVTYNKISPRNISDAYNAIRLYAEAGPNWVNENIIFAGRIHNSASAVIPDSCGIFIDSAGTTPNGNKIIGPSIEGQGFDFAIRLRGQNNSVYHPRTELVGETASVEVGNCANGQATNNNWWYGSTATVTISGPGSTSYRVDAIYFYAVPSVTRADGGPEIPGVLLPQNMPEIRWMPESANAYLAYINADNKWGFFRLGTERLSISAAGGITARGPIYINSGETIGISTNNGTPEAAVTRNPGSLCVNTGAGRPLWVKNSGTGNTGWQPILCGTSATATLDFPSIAAGSDEELTITVTGAAVGDAVLLGPPATLEADLVATGYVSATNTVTIRLSNPTGSPIDPASATWRATVVKA